MQVTHLGMRKKKSWLNEFVLKHIVYWYMVGHSRRGMFSEKKVEKNIHDDMIVRNPKQSCIDYRCFGNVKERPLPKTTKNP